MQLLAEMDGFENRGDVRIIGATNRIDILDKALLRPGRFDRIIEIPLPDIDGRLSILKIQTVEMNLDPSVDLQEIALRTEGRNGADLRAITMEAGMFAIRSDRDLVTREDLVRAIDKFVDEVERNRGIGTASAMFA